MKRKKPAWGFHFRKKVAADYTIGSRKVRGGGGKEKFQPSIFGGENLVNRKKKD